MLIGEIYNLSISNNLGEWRARESSELSAQVMKRIGELQNPADCESSKKIICDLSKACGFGCQMHHVMYCFITAWYTNRTMILESAGWRYNSAGFEAYFKPLSDTCKSTNDNALGWNRNNKNITGSNSNILNYDNSKKCDHMMMEKKL